MRKKREYEVTCDCTAYSFPHRFGGGRCTGIHIVEEAWYSNYGNGECRQCNLHDNGTCQVVDGIEKVSECLVYQDYIRYNEIRVYKQRRAS